MFHDCSCHRNIGTAVSSFVNGIENPQFVVNPPFAGVVDSIPTSLLVESPHFSWWKKGTDSKKLRHGSRGSIYHLFGPEGWHNTCSAGMYISHVRWILIISMYIYAYVYIWIYCQWRTFMSYLNINPKKDIFVIWPRKLCKKREICPQFQVLPAWWSISQMYLRYLIIMSQTY